MHQNLQRRVRGISDHLTIRQKNLTLLKGIRMRVKAKPKLKPKRKTFMKVPVLSIPSPESGASLHEDGIKGAMEASRHRTFSCGNLEDDCLKWEVD